MNKPTIFAAIYAIAIALLQYVLMSAMPNTGMGATALFYVIWPLLAISVLAVYWIMRSVKGSRVLTLLVATGLAAFASIAVYPQDDHLSFSQKIEKITSWIGNN